MSNNEEHAHAAGGGEDPIHNAHYAVTLSNNKPDLKEKASVSTITCVGEPVSHSAAKVAGTVEDVTAALETTHIEKQTAVDGDTFFPIPGEAGVSIHYTYLQANGVDPSELMAALLAIPMVHGTEPISKDTVTFVGGDHIALKYRGNNAPKHKFQFTTETGGIPIYHYTGWTWMFTLATYMITMMATVIQNAVKDLADPNSNHFIVAMYKDGNDYIGPHFDKPKDIQEGSNIDVWKLGAPRKFVFEDLKGKVLWAGTVPAGSLIRMSLEANLKYKHSVPKDPSVKELSASIVGRNIKTVVPCAERDKKFAKSALGKYG